MKILRSCLFIFFFTFLPNQAFSQPRQAATSHSREHTSDLLPALNDCEHAKENIAELEKEKVSTADRARRGIKAVLPVRAVVKILAGEYSHGAKVTSGRYNNDLEKKIAEIKYDCHIE